MDEVLKSGMDAGVVRTEISDDQMAKNRQQALDDYNGQVIDINRQIKDANAILSQLNEAYAAREEDLNAMYIKKETDFNLKMSLVREQIDQMMNQSLILDTEIKEKQAQRDAISLDFAAQAEELNVKQQSISDQAKVLASAQLQLDSDRAVFAQIKEDSRAAAQSIADALDRRQKNLDEQQSSIDIASSEATRISRENIQKEQGLAQQVKDLQDLQVVVAQQQQDALGIIAQASDVQKQKVENEAVILNNTKQTEQNRRDADQIRVAKIALANKTQDVQQREQAVTQAEQKIGG